MNQLQTQYAKVGDDRIACQVIGEGPLDLVATAGIWGHIELESEDPGTSSRAERTVYRLQPLANHLITRFALTRRPRGTVTPNRRHRAQQLGHALVLLLHV